MILLQALKTSLSKHKVNNETNYII